MILYDGQHRLFHLTNEFLSMVLSLRTDEVGETEVLMPWFGAPLKDPSLSLGLLLNREGASFDSLRQILPHACPTGGRGDYRPALVTAAEPSGQRCTELFYRGHRIEAGKPTLPGLPATYVEDPEEADTLTLALEDPRTHLLAAVSYTLYAHRPVVTCSVNYSNMGSDPLVLNAAGSFCLSLNGPRDMLHLHGGWAKERAVEKIPAGHMTRSISSCRGASGHEHNPFTALMTPGADEFRGECVGVNLVYSGDFRIAVDQNGYGTTRLIAGLNPETLNWHLDPGASLQAPEAVCVYSASGLNAMSAAFHDLYRSRLCRGIWRDRERPVLINNWEATYFGFNHEKLLKIARTAADVGVELFVLDDGWFGKRDSDNCSLGDWVADRKKLPGGIEAIAKDINALGLRFGLWFEPEMVSPDSDLYRAHPDWCLHAEGRRRTEARQQLILDMSRPEVQDYVIDSLSRVLKNAPVGYVKWDMNRNFKEAGSATLPFGRQGEIGHRYMLGLYRVLETLTSSFPEVLFECCSGGGGRFDAGMLYYMPQTWTSDDSDATERLFIQYGTSLCYPCSAMGAHVSAVPNHQVGRVTSMRFRGDVALGGNFGYELDLSAQTPEDLEEIRRQIKMIKDIRSTTAKGRFTRLLSPFESNTVAWQFVDDKRLILCIYRILVKPNAEQVIVRPADLPAGTYRAEDGTLLDASDLMNIGIVPNLPWGDFVSQVLVFERV